MQNRIVEISSEGAYLSVSRGFMSVRVKDTEAGQVAIDDMAALVVRGNGASISINLCARLAQANVPVVICGTDQAPASVLWPVDGHFAQGLRMQAQAVANKPLLKRLWAQMVRAKITAQADVLALMELDAADLRAMARRVKSGDAENLEAQAARRYWLRLMGDDFRRDRAQEGANAALNYGYTVLRAGAARAIVAAGLHPSLSINHQSRGDALRLADDLMEPFRPWVDLRVKQLAGDGASLAAIVLTPETKRFLTAVLQLDLDTRHGASPLQLCMDRMAQSLVRVFTGDDALMDLPGPALPLAATHGAS
ncbi:MAG: type II CRISPR-associated endonuclease Cas1 [Pseudomonadota bacterium]